MRRCITSMHGDEFSSCGRKIILIAIFFSFSTMTTFSQVAVNDNGEPPDEDAMLDVSATDKGILIPRLTLANRPPATKTGMLIYQTDGMAGFYYANGSAWLKVGDASSDYWIPATGDDIRFPNRVALGAFTDADYYGLNVQNLVGGRAAVRGATQSEDIILGEGMLAFLFPSVLNIPLNVDMVGVLGIIPSASNGGAAVYGWNNRNNGINYGSVFYSDGTGAGTNYGVYSLAKNGSTNYGIDARATGTGNNYALNAYSNNGSANFAGTFKGRVTVEGHDGSTSALDSLNTLVDVQVKHHYAADTRAIDAYSVPQPGWGYGLFATGGYRGVYGFGDGTTYNGYTYGVLGYATGTAGYRYGVYGQAYNPDGISAYGVYGSASGALINWAGYFDGSTHIATDLRIATTTQATGYALSVYGKIACEEVLVDYFANWPDYVFRDDYPLLSISDLEKSIEENGHLPGLPSGDQVEEHGFELADMQRRVLEKVEELTLYTIEQEKMIEQLRLQIEEMKTEIENLKKENRTVRL